MLAVGILYWTPLPAQTDDAAPPFAGGIIERSGVTVMLVDVEVTDENGAPLPGLTADDFVITLDGRRWPLYSVDELCDCAAAVVSASEAGATTDDAARTSAPQAPPAAQSSETPVGEPVRFVLYLDFSQLQPWSREFAVAEASRWTRETKRPGDEVMLAAFATQAGLRVLSEFTSDGRQLLAAIAAANDDEDLLDPFPSMRDVRQMRCKRCCTNACALEEACCTGCSACGPCASTCLDVARMEHAHGKRSLQALRRLIATLEPSPGRTSLILFQENGTLFPARYYPVDEARVGDHLTLLDDVAAEATLSRTTVHAASLGDPGRSISGRIWPTSREAATAADNPASRG